MKIPTLIFLVTLAVGASAQDVPRAKWIENGLIDAGGTHEPTIFVVRRGGQRLDAREQNELAESEDTLRTLKEQGIEVFHTHLYKGFGMAAEMPGMEQTKDTAEVAHRLGLKVDTYIQWNSMMYETFFAEEPRARNWIQRDASGRPAALAHPQVQAGAEVQKRADDIHLGKSGRDGGGTVIQSDDRFRWQRSAAPPDAALHRFLQDES